MHSYRLVSSGRRFFSSSSSSYGGRLEIHEDVQKALREQRPVVALESTIITHGLRYPENLHLSKRLGAILRDRGVEPATIAIKDGVCRVGLTVDELEDLARSGEEGRAVKCSTREIPLHCGRKTAMWGATTVASTMKLAHLAGISTFVTGGIGGVHRHSEITMDVSADLTELARTSVIVVSAGIKSILDIPRTLEVLETNGVPVMAYQTDEFPAFFSPYSGVAAPARVDSAEEVAEAYLAAQDLGLSHGMIVAVPNRDPVGANVEDAIQAALVEAEQRAIRGQAVTPFVLKRVAEITGGDSLRSNMALVEQNAVVGAEIAIAISRRKNRPPSFVQTSTFATPPVIVMGGIVLDVIAKPKKGHKLTLGTSNPASCKESDGGVARNIAETLGRLGSQPLLFSAVGNDLRGSAILNRLENDCGILFEMDTMQRIDGANTATYLAVLDDDGDLHTACADMEVLDRIRPPPLELLKQSKMLVMDANPPVEVIEEAAARACSVGVPVFFEPTSVPKAMQAAKHATFLSYVSFASPNLEELFALDNTTAPDDVSIKGDGLVLVKDTAREVLARMHPSGAHLLVTCGADGVLLASKEEGQYTFELFQSSADIAVANATGAGDTLSGAFIYAILNGAHMQEAVSFGIVAAKLSLSHADSAISPLLSDLRFDS